MEIYVHNLFDVHIFSFFFFSVWCYHIHSAWSESSAACLRPRGRRRGGEKLASGAFAMLQRRGPQSRAHIWVVFSCKGAERGKWRGPKDRADALAIVVLWRKEERAARPVGPSRRAHFGGVWSKTPNSRPRHLATGCFQGNQYVTLSSSVLFRAIAIQKTVLPPSRALILRPIDRKSIKMADFSKTGSRNMAETCAINFLTLVSYSTSIVIGGLRRLLPVLMWAGVDFEYFRAETVCWYFLGFSTFDHPWSIVVGA